MITHFKLPVPLFDLIYKLQSKNISIVLVGGSVRNYLLEGTVPRDLDFEYRFDDSSTLLKKYLEEFSSRDVKELPFNVFKLCFDGLDLEFSKARTEEYSTQLSYGHSDFSVDFESSLDFKSSFLRRDFTINAIGISFKNSNSLKTAIIGNIIDPFDGVKDLKEKLLVPCGRNFYKDPVRFLRMIRFSLDYKFSIAPQLESKLKEFNLTGLTGHYLFKEGFKSSFLKFIESFFKLCQKHSIACPHKFDCLKVLNNLDSEIEIRDKNDLYWFLIVKLKAHSVEIELFLKLIPVKKSLLKKYTKLMNLREELSSFNLLSIKDLKTSHRTINPMFKLLYELNKLSLQIDINLDFEFSSEFISKYTNINCNTSLNTDKNSAFITYCNIV